MVISVAYVKSNFDAVDFESKLHAAVNELKMAHDSRLR